MSTSIALMHPPDVAAQAAGLDEADSTSIAELYERAASLRLQLTPTTLEVTS